MFAKRSRHIRSALCCSAIVVFVVYIAILAWSEDFEYSIEEEEEKELQYTDEYSEEDFIKLIVSIYGKSRFLEEFCLSHDTCMDVRDELVKRKNRTYFMRAARKYTLILTRIPLSLPKRRTRRHTDTSKWEINFGDVTGDATSSMIEVLYDCGALKQDDEDSKAKVLSLGLGGGFLNGYMHHKFPQMSITVVEINARTLEMARRWFGLETDEQHEVILMDGIEYIERSVRKGRRFDYIFLDACFAKTSNHLICPNSPFLSKEIIAAMAKLLEKKGVLVVNILPRGDSRKEVLEKITSKFKRHFEFWKLRHVQGTNNYILTLSQFEYTGLHINETSLQFE
ncbi:hypothetical protein RB195_008488 [Necator americanus]